MKMHDKFENDVKSSVQNIVNLLQKRQAELMEKSKKIRETKSKKKEDKKHFYPKFVWNEAKTNVIASYQENFI